MYQISDLIIVADAYKRAAEVDADQTVSYRVFSDSKKLAALRDGGEITTRRFNAALNWFDANWPKACTRPAVLNQMLVHPTGVGGRS